MCDLPKIKKYTWRNLNESLEIDISQPPVNKYENFHSYFFPQIEACPNCKLKLVLPPFSVVCFMHFPRRLATITPTIEWWLHHTVT